jgi:hypothetical protein
MILFDVDDDRQGDDVITASEIIREHGRAYYDRMLEFRLRHHDQRGRPYWTLEEAERIFGLIEIEERGKG